MDINEILAKCDHTLLKQTAVWTDIKQLCDDAIYYHTASVCIPPAFVKRAKYYCADRMTICTVIGFPNGNTTTEAKIAEAKDAVENGADELDMVINIGMLKEGRYDDVEEEIRSIKNVCGDRILKVIIECCLLTDEEKRLMCSIVSRSGADFIKTSTGFSTGGATFEDVDLMVRSVTNGVKVKAAGGISSLADAEKFIELGAQRLGTSRIVKLAKELEAKQ